MGLKQLEPTIKKVGENTFAITPFPAMKAANLSGQLGAFIGPVIGSFAPLISKVFNAQKDGGEQGSTGDSLMDKDVTEAASALSGLSAIDGDKLETLIRRLLLGGNITVRYSDEDGEPHTEKLNEDLANELFCGEVQDMFVLAVHVIRLNFSGFFERLTAQSGLDGSASAKVMRQIL